MTQEEWARYEGHLRRMMSKFNLRLGQALLNENPELGPCPEIFYAEDEQKVYAWVQGNLLEGGASACP